VKIRINLGIAATDCDGETALRVSGREAPERGEREKTRGDGPVKRHNQEI